MSKGSIFGKFNFGNSPAYYNKHGELVPLGWRGAEKGRLFYRYNKMDHVIGFCCRHDDERICGDCCIACGKGHSRADRLCEDCHAKQLSPGSECIICYASFRKSNPVEGKRYTAAIPPAFNKNKRYPWLERSTCPSCARGIAKERLSESANDEFVWRMNNLLKQNGGDYYGVWDGEKLVPDTKEVTGSEDQSAGSPGEVDESVN